MATQDSKLENLSEKLNSYTELGGLVTIQDQLARYNDLTSQRKVLSRVFGALGVMLPQGADEVKLSELRVDLDTNLISMEGQTDAKVAPLIDYRVLEAFKKSVDLTKYDYGRYVDANGDEIPTQCVDEANAEGSAYREGDSYYAWWDLRIPGCEGLKIGERGDAKLRYSEKAEVETGKVTVKVPVTVSEGSEEQSENNNESIDENNDSDNGDEDSDRNDDSSEEEYVSVEKEMPVRVKIWRTPRFDNWYKEGKMSLDGAISGIEHFESKCYNYSGTEADKTVRWESSNDCMLAPDGLEISGSSNGRDDSDNLVLRFTASVNFTKEFFSFANKHMIAIGPLGQNVTDSFVQIGGMFTKATQACAEDDPECLNNTNNNGGRENDKGEFSDDEEER